MQAGILAVQMHTCSVPEKSGGRMVTRVRGLTGECCVGLAVVILVFALAAMLYWLPNSNVSPRVLCSTPTELYCLN